MKKPLLNNPKNKYICPVCNFDGLDEPPYNSCGSGSYEICPCCGFEFGLDDFGYDSYEKAHAVWRKKWIDNGCIWWSSQENRKPKDWDPIKQLNNNK